LYGTGSLGKYGAGIGTDELYRSDNKDEDYRQHHGVLSDVLAFIVTPEVIEHRHGWTPQWVLPRGEKLCFARENARQRKPRYCAPIPSSLQE